MRIVDALTARNQLTPAYDPASEDLQRERRERQAAEHARAVVSMMDEIPRRELSFGALGGRVIEHVTSRDGDYYRLFGGDPAFTGDDVTRYFVAEDGTPTMLERAHNPCSRAEVEQIQARKQQRRAERDAHVKQQREALKAQAKRAGRR